ncbi:ABC transporter permease [Betaproteobacteria bacterium]|nr:ABC transporter permease [Betaproteobacteria bacterium]
MRKAAAVFTVISASLLFAGSADAQMMRDKYNILLLTDLSSSYSESSGPGDVAAAKLAIEEFGGKINGVPINLITADTKLDPAVAVNKARELIDTVGLSQITSLSGSSVALAVGKLANERKVLTTVADAGTTRLTNEDCAKYVFHIGYNTNAMSIPVKMLIKDGVKKWYLISADMAFGKSLRDSFAKAIKESGGELVGEDLTPFPADEFSSYLLKAKASGAQGVGLLSSGQDLRNVAKQAYEFGLLEAGIKIVPGQLNLSDVKGSGAEVWAGSLAALISYWDFDDETRKFAARFHKMMGFHPGDTHSSNYVAVREVLKTVEKLGTDDPDKVVAALEGLKTGDAISRNATWRKKDHMVEHDFYVGEGKQPKDIKDEDYFKIIATIPGAEALGSESESTCKHDW